MLTTNRIYLNSVKWDSDYRNVVLFNGTFSSYITSTALFTISNSLQITNNTIRVPYNQQQLIAKNVNYLTFVNEQYSSKFYGNFIKNIKFINENLSEIEFEEDVFSNYFNANVLKPCFVEREHIATKNDKINVNTLAEPVSLGVKEIMTAPSRFNIDYNPSKILLIANVTIDSSHQDFAPHVINGFLQTNSYTLYDFNQSGANQLNSNIKSLINDNKKDSIVAILLVPNICANATTETLSIIPETENGIFEGYIPKNKKLYTSQFCNIIVDDQNGTIKEYAFEKCASPSFTFKLTATGLIAPTPELVYYPNNYSGISENLMEAVYINQFTQCSFNINSFDSFVASQKNTIALSALSSSLKGIFSPLGLLQDVGNVLNIADKSPDSISSNNTNAIKNAKSFNKIVAYVQSVNYENAKKIDSFLSTYGYNCQETKTPNINNRAIFNYVKTKNCCISAFHSEVNRKLNDIFNSGVFIWHSASNVGNFDFEKNI